MKVSLNDFVEKEVDEKYYMTLEKFESIKFESSKRLYDRLAPTLPTSQGGYQQPKILWSKEERKILSKDLYFLHNIQKREFVTTGFKNICPTLMSSDAKGNQKQLFGVDEETKEFFIRSLTPREYERLQGFEDDYTSICSDSQRYKQL